MASISETQRDLLSGIYSNAIVNPYLRGAVPSLSEEQKKCVLDILKLVDLSTESSRLAVVRELSDSTPIITVIHSTIAPLQELNFRAFDSTLINEALGHSPFYQEEICDEAIIKWWDDYGSLFDKKTIASLSRNEVMHLASLMVKLDTVDDKVAYLFKRLPPWANSFVEFIQPQIWPLHVWSLSQKLSGYNASDSYRIIAQIIAKEHFRLCDLHLSSAKLLELAPYLDYADFKGLKDDELIYQILEKGVRLKMVVLDGNTISKIPSIDCLHMRIHCCNNLEIISQPLSFLKFINIKKCNALHCITSAMPQCTSFLIEANPILKILPAVLPCCENFEMSRCPRVRFLPDMPITTFSEITYPVDDLQINYEEFVPHPERKILPLGPKGVLLTLGRNYLLKDQMFPRIVLLENGAPTRAIDIGGVGRSLVTITMEKLFDHFFASENILSRSPNGMPRADENEDSKDAYRSLGRIFALCCLEGSPYKTGALFSDFFYECLTVPEPHQSNWLLVNILRKMGLDIRIARLLEGHIEEFLIADINTAYFLYNIDPTPKELAGARAFFACDLNRNSLRRQLLNNASCNLELKATNWIANELQIDLGPELFTSIISKGAGALKERIEGNPLTSEDLVGHLQWGSSPNVDPGKLYKTKNRIVKWVMQANQEQMRLFVKAVTGNNSLTERKIIVNFFNRAEALPFVHTCFNLVEISAEYPSKAILFKKVDEMISYSLASAGYQER